MVKDGTGNRREVLAYSAVGTQTPPLRSALPNSIKQGVALRLARVSESSSFLPRKFPQIHEHRG